MGAMRIVMKHTRMGWNLGSILIMSSIVLFGQTIQAWNYPSLTPPLGNSLMMKTKTDNGRQMYNCNSKEWVLVGTAADLVLADNQSVRIGVHKSDIVNGQRKSVETWIFENPIGDAAESGSKFSSVSGKVVFSVASKGVISEALLKATSHRAQGRASLVSYIQRLSPKGGVPPLKEACDQDSTEVEVPYEAEYWIWHQDMLPPSMPSSLALSSERVVQGLYGEGVVFYRFSGENWEQEQAEAKLYNVPGGIPSGKYSMESAFSTSAGEMHRWKFFNPNGFHVMGTSKSPPVTVDNNCLPWSLMTITQHTGNVSVLGEYTHVQMLSTSGGVPATLSKFKPVPGLRWKAPFSAVFWFYTNQS
ncbi:hypothetical protein O6H91_20G069900 [Diphasiastrum complanatum]|uniref:Uncharacterized protein n=2 Tax=Diphasiastrum complanatum TaxID=34168 RepID=A0ACC2ARI8_DIPCM|nr:hypothetical protein O6H91_20G069900 [Diphasiastrum complanatum]KAJ7520159.1 hypothetical protein O6H91_20G069900 [Diphasiastrum complanatum]